MSDTAAQELKGCGVVQCRSRKAASCVFLLAAAIEAKAGAFTETMHSVSQQGVSSEQKSQMHVLWLEF